MDFSFSDADFQRIASVLEVPAKHDGALVRFKLHDEASGRHLSLEIAQGVALPKAVATDQPANLVSIYAASSFLQLQGCTGFIASQELGEVIFFARRGGVANGLVIERQAGCSLFANVDERLLTTDFTQLAPELIMSTVALSMSETLFNDFN
ncbi:MAG: hypothetical protein R3247_02595 [Rhodothermales bacterium]|nr:hypothetical protein [Rhodothermales bacterium]